MRGLAVANRWFQVERIDDDIAMLVEPHVHPMVRCNIWYVRGRELDLVIDTGMGMSPLRPELARITGDSGRPILAVLTHAHFDHVGSWHEFSQRAVHPAEPLGAVGALCGPAPLLPASYDPDYVATLVASGCDLGQCLVDAVPHADFDVAGFALEHVGPTRFLVEGDVLDLGNRTFEVMHLPGHSAGSIGLWDSVTGVLFSGDAICEGAIFDTLPGSNLDDYQRTMHRLRDLPLCVVHAGHEASFGRGRLVEMADAYLRDAGQ
jgi:glyoxylase-like metal-dependent hydrolase (beta-lactamase superfamily II)